MSEERVLRGPEALFKTDKGLEQEGIWIDYGDFRIKISRAGPSNKKFKRAFEAAMKPHRRAMANDTLSDKVADRVTQQVWAETIVMGWDSPLGGDVIPYGDGELKFNAENCVKLFQDLPDLFVDIREQSTKLGLFVADAETDAGN